MLYLLVRAFLRGQRRSRRDSVAPADRPSRRTCWMVERRSDGRGHVQAADIDASGSEPSLAVSARMREQRRLGQWRAADRAIPERPVKRAAAMKTESPSTPPPHVRGCRCGHRGRPGSAYIPRRRIKGGDQVTTRQRIDAVRPSEQQAVRPDRNPEKASAGCDLRRTSMRPAHRHLLTRWEGDGRPAGLTTPTTGRSRRALILLPAGAWQAPLPTVRAGQARGLDPGTAPYRHLCDSRHRCRWRMVRGFGRSLARNVGIRQQRRRHLPGAASPAWSLLGDRSGQNAADARQRRLPDQFGLGLRCRRFPRDEAGQDTPGCLGLPAL